MGGWTLRVDDENPISDPTGEHVREALLDLDGSTRTLVALSRGGRDCLVIGGGNDGRCLVDYLADIDTQEDYVLADPLLPGGERDLVIGGQWSGPYPGWACVGKSLALEAASAFLRTGRFPDHLVWTTLSQLHEGDVFDPSRRVQLPVTRRAP